MKAAFFQFHPRFGRKEDNLHTVRQASGKEDIDLLVLPEFFATGYQFVSEAEVAELSERIPDGDTTQALLELSRQHHIYIVAGLPEAADGVFYNSAVLTGPEGLIGVYRKTHLFFEENLFFTPGNTGFLVRDTPIGRIGIMICFDWFFPESMRTLALMGAEVVAHPSNLVLPFCPDAMPVRCLENRIFAITANRTGTESRKQGQSLTFIGKSEIVSPNGNILARAPEDQEVLIVSDIDPHVSRDKKLNEYNDILKDRRPALYGNPSGS